MNEQRQEAIWKTAFELQAKGISFIPVRRIAETVMEKGKPKLKKAKSSYISWKNYQTERPTLEDVIEWKEKFPNANIAIITGRINELFIVDVDNDEGKEQIGGLSLPEAPTIATGKGFHKYFKRKDSYIKIKTTLGIYFFTNNLKIPEEKINHFLTYCEYRNILEEYNNNNLLLVIKILQEESKSYHEIEN